MPNTSIEARRAYHRAYSKKYREAHRESERQRHREYWQRKHKKPFMIILHPDTDKVLQSIPNPFGSFKKAKYIIYKDMASTVHLYSFVTTCRNTEDCINIMKDKFKLFNEYRKAKPKFCSIYKIQDGIKELIFREII